MNIKLRFLVVIVSCLIFSCTAKHNYDDNDKTESWNGKDVPASADTSMTDITKNAVSESSEVTKNLPPLAQFVSENITDKMLMIELSEMGSKKATNHALKQVAQQMAKDHTKMLEQLTQLAQAKKITLENNPHINVADKGVFEKTSGVDFNKLWHTQMLKMHEAKIQELQNVMAYTKDAEMKNLAFNHLTIIKNHREKLLEISPR